MNKRIEEIISELNVRVDYDSNLDNSGYYIAAINCIVLNSSLDEFKLTKTLLHELGHASEHQEKYELYNMTFTMHSKMETEAETFMAKELVKEYSSLYNTDVRSFNYMNFIKDNKLSVDLAPKVKEWFLKYNYNS